MGLKDIFSAFNSLSQVQCLPSDKRRLVFYSEGPSTWPHLKPVIDGLILYENLGVVYLTSSQNDPGLSYRPDAITSLFIGDGIVRTRLMNTLSAKCFVMSTPDINSFHIKKSPNVDEYIYVHHSMVSTHMIYRPHAFDSFDTIFCVGPHHVKEVQERETLYNLPKKALIHHGYGRLDQLIAEQQSTAINNALPKIVIAPTWGTQALLETHGQALVEASLKDSRYDIVLRPHPRTRKLAPKILDSIAKQFSSHPRFTIEENVVSTKSIDTADLMISDWSGVALEYAFSRKRPVLFIDLPPKVNNPDYDRCPSEPLEVFIREVIGKIISPGDIQELSNQIDLMLSEVNHYEAAITNTMDRWIYNVGHSGQIGADYIARQLGIAP